LTQPPLPEAHIAKYEKQRVEDKDRLSFLYGATDSCFISQLTYCPIQLQTAQECDATKAK
jgi:hypothetical protein